MERVRVWVRGGGLGGLKGVEDSVGGGWRGWRGGVELGLGRCIDGGLGLDGEGVGWLVYLYVWTMV